MSGDYAREVRRAVLPALKTNGTLTNLVPAASIYPSTVPASRPFPFIRYGIPILSPFRATGLDTSSLRVTIAAFTKPRMNQAGAVTATAEDAVYDIGSAIKDTLDNTTLTLESGLKVRLTWLGTTPRMDPDEADAWATSVTFSAEVSG